MQILFLVLSILLGAAAQVLLKIGALKGTSISGISLLVNPIIMSGLFLYGCSALLWIFALKKVPLSQAYPMVSAGYVIVFLLSYWLLKEDISGVRILGLIVILIGVIIISKS